MHLRDEFRHPSVTWKKGGKTLGNVRARVSSLSSVEVRPVAVHHAFYPRAHLRGDCTSDEPPGARSHDKCDGYFHSWIFNSTVGIEST